MKSLMNFAVLPESVKGLIAKFKGHDLAWCGYLLGVANAQPIEGQAKHFEDHVTFKILPPAGLQF